MKYITSLLFTVLLVLVTNTVSAQGDLQFSQVINYDLFVQANGSTYYGTDEVTLTVPAGKVWKIESGHLSERITNSNQYHIPGGYLLLDGSIIAGESSNNYDPKFPIWLSPGTYTITLQGGTNSSDYAWTAFVSIIEFNVVAQ